MAKEIVILFAHLKKIVMATKKKASKKANDRFGKLEFSVPILQENAGKSAAKRKENAEKEFRQKVYPNLENHELWNITSLKWKGPIKPKMKEYILTAGLKRNHKNGPPSGDATVAKPTTPPPSA